jgi:ABC-type uncharacterized transport system fused permease/ATPase subunit
MNDHAYQEAMLATDSKERIALFFIRFRKPILLLIIGFIVYSKFGTPCVRLNYEYVGSEANKRITWARCLTTSGYVEFSDHVPMFFFMKNGRVTFPRG